MRTLDRISTFLAIAPMMFVCLLPYSTALLARYINSPVALAVYLSNQFATIGFITILWARTMSLGNLEDGSLDEYQSMSTRLYMLTFAFLISAATALVSPERAFFVCRDYDSRTCFPATPQGAKPP